ncbi:MAG: elongation factor P lysine(34) lysyltransferase [Gammaproteobacteria bacterium CG_4_10_14_0_8_um_filter_38_16]|nr:MAG: elongation factor P lysine(34) lysyltransferase [Gammaproteobacteria bacterium CG_4_10_14_0_8_um_filter_38_16]PJA03147.1 MAG: elongation factor P lysine(34) lysyltransferase [Gammaproteobacteria bacterium CG_4_10_14_0_2_um_filter_38_22]PJB10530.1 MAG: elongation factor P lysine(34) lysyltransferase [Gammaproteobacteria bacterium CG_4_9_14_3_um_filter_38_9]
MSIRDNLQKRADLYAKIRAFFAERNVLEVETPLLCQHTVTDPHIDSFAVPINTEKNYFLQTSPEYAMKRLLAAGSGPIYQITKSFRVGESGHQHNPEFTMLEWYRIGFNHHDLMDELDALLQYTLQTKPAKKINYRQLFLSHLNIDPFKTDITVLKKRIRDHHIMVDTHEMNHDTALQILLSHLIEPKLGIQTPLFLYDFPPSQAALSKIRQDNPAVAERFELYIAGSEIANGFHELTDATEQQKRFEKNQLDRKHNQQAIPAIDHYFIDALKSGLPACAGVAIGIDRLLMKKTKTHAIQDVISFPFDHA